MKRALLSMLLVLYAAFAALAAAPAAEEKKAPPTAAEKIAGRWSITLDGLSFEHHEILASLAVDGDMLIGTLTAERATVNVASGRVVGTEFTFAFTHSTGEVFKMKGSATARGLEGVWEARGEKGKWRARRRGA